MAGMLPDTIQKRQLVLLKVNCLFWLFTKLITYNAWIKDRTLPTVSFIALLDDVPAWVHTLLYFSSVLLLSVCTIKTTRNIMILFLSVEICSVLLDALRLQPWEYMYLTIFFTGTIYINRPKMFLRCLLFLLSSTYIFSGLHKFSGAFLSTIWDDFILHDAFGMKKAYIGKYLHYSGLLISCAEFSLGILLLFSKVRKYAAISLIGMHVIIIVVLGGIMNGYNFSVLPWNIVMIVYLSAFIRTSATDKEHLPIGVRLLIFIFWFALPFSNLFGFWVHSLSSGMYTGKTHKVYVCISETTAGAIKKVVKSTRNKKPYCANNVTVNMYDWTVNETDVAPFPEIWYYTRLLHSLKQKYDSDTKMFYTVYPHGNVKELN